jgi:hypothetical protein
MASAESPYGLDFLFTDITDVHFSGDYVCIGLDCSQDKFTPTLDSVNVSFPGLAGGTPGAALLPASKIVRGYPLPVAATELGQAIITDAGSSQLSGFARNNINGVYWDNPPSFGFSGYTKGDELYVKLKQAAFDMQINVAGHETLGGSGFSQGWGAQVNCRMITKNTIKTGATLPAKPHADTAGGAVFFRSTVAGQAPSSSFTMTFHVDPGKRTVKCTGGTTTSSTKIQAYFYNDNTTTNF